MLSWPCVRRLAIPILKRVHTLAVTHRLQHEESVYTFVGCPKMQRPLAILLITVYSPNEVLLYSVFNSRPQSKRLTTSQQSVGPQ